MNVTTRDRDLLDVATLAPGRELVPIEAEPEQPSETDGEWFWSIEPQDKIDIRLSSPTTVEIHQISPLGESEDQRITVSLANAVKLSRMILFAAGFQVVGIYTAVRGGNVDLSDGAQANEFDFAERGRT